MAEGETQNRQQIGDTLVFSPPFDRERENNTESLLADTIAGIHAYYSTYHLDWIEDPDAIARIKGLIQPIKILLIKSNELTAYKELKLWEEEIRSLHNLPTLDTLTHLEKIEETFVFIMAKHGHKDKSTQEYEWDMKLKKKLHIQEVSEEHLTAYGNQDRVWKEICWWMDYHCVVNKGAVHCLVTGINNSGKTSTAVPMLRECNKGFREYWKVSYSPNEWIEIPKFSLKRNVIYIPVASDMDDFLGQTQYNTTDFNEGMNAAVNLRSMKQEVIDMGVNAYITRSHHNIFFYEYQMTSRPPALLMELFNFWIHKVSPQWAILSMPSGVYRKKDPLYLQELDKLRTDDAINKWLKYQNPNYITTFRTPRMSPKNEERFKKLQTLAHEKMRESKEVRQTLTDTYFLLVKNMYERINIDNEIAFIELDRILDEDYHLNKKQRTSFMRDYNKYEAIQKLTGGRKRKAQVILS